MPIRTLHIQSDLFTSRASEARSEKGLVRALALLTGLNLDYLRQFPDTPPLYEAGVVYKSEREVVSGVTKWPEWWKTIPEIMRDGHGDCEDLACWRAAELRMRGVDARATFQKKDKGDMTLYHIVVKRGSRYEDPSKRLGMD